MRARSSTHRVLIIHDGGSLAAMEKKGNLGHYVESLYNPGNFFDEAHILVFDKADLAVRLKNPTLRVHYLRQLVIGGDVDGSRRSGEGARVRRYVGRGLSLPFMAYQAARIVRRERITVIRARNAYLAGVIAVLAGKSSGVPVVVSLGGDNRIAQELLKRYYTYSRFLSFTIEEFSLRLADRVFCTNEFTRHYAIRLGVRPERTCVVPHRVEANLLGAEDASAARRELKVGDRPTILFIGRFERDKQVDVLVEAIPGILQRYPDALFLFVGDGSMRAELEERCRELKSMSSVVFAGFQPRERLAKYLAAANVVWVSMSGFVPYEAAAAGRPVVAFDVEWHSEFVEHNVTGLLVKDRDVGDLERAVITLLDNPALARSFAANAEKRFHEQCDSETLIEKEIQEYEKVIGATIPPEKHYSMSETGE
jgi:glycosyltransferase involved in cell wall biosynthesis